MVERRSELDRRYQRKKKLRKLKHKLKMATDAREKEKIQKKIHVISPQWNAVRDPNAPKAPPPAKEGKPARSGGPGKR